jgi:hypothetical protein
MKVFMAVVDRLGRELNIGDYVAYRPMRVSKVQIRKVIKMWPKTVTLSGWGSQPIQYPGSLIKLNIADIPLHDRVEYIDAYAVIDPNDPEPSYEGYPRIDNSLYAKDREAYNAQRKVYDEFWEAYRAKRSAWNTRQTARAEATARQMIAKSS